ncbi:hypothetical protein SEUCBS139899_009432 [Sporothrix eucalyptigena]|uniref:Stress-response A/B barrel domain-containing protein n=1 Tax=Sporothrix eucalyptigena TaxID=1812306 RepID=A0ABP0CH21_9PEZI
MTFTHIVLFQFKASADPEAVKKGCARFLELGTACVHPTTQKPYVLSVQGGKDNSIEPFAHDNTHGFVMEFATAADRAYYVHEDPAHSAFVASVKEMVEKITVLDFTSGEF